jgi:outer membrane lipoprotein-sorting protein
VLGLALALAPAAQAQELDEVLTSYYEAMGGLDKLKAIDTLKMTGKMAMGEGIEAPATMLQKRPDMVRQEFTFQGMTGVQAYDGETAWMHMPFMGQAAPELMPQEMASEFVEGGEMDGPLIDAEARGIALELVGREDVEGTEAFHIKVTRANGDVEHHYLDGEYYIPIKVTRTTKAMGQETEVSMTFGDYKEIDGLLFPHSIDISGGQAGMSLILDEISVNQDIDDSLFTMPAAEEAADTPAEG